MPDRHIRAPGQVGDVVHFAGEVGLDVEDQRPGLLLENLLEQWIDCPCGLARADAAKNDRVLAGIFLGCIKRFTLRQTGHMRARQQHAG